MTPKQRKSGQTGGGGYRNHGPSMGRSAARGGRPHGRGGGSGSKPPKKGSGSSAKSIVVLAVGIFGTAAAAIVGSVGFVIYQHFV